jgi:hypothetical protein
MLEYFHTALFESLSLAGLITMFSLVDHETMRKTSDTARILGLNSPWNWGTPVRVFHKYGDLLVNNDEHGWQTVTYDDAANMEKKHMLREVLPPWFYGLAWTAHSAFQWAFLTFLFMMRFLHGNDDTYIGDISDVAFGFYLALQFVLKGWPVVMMITFRYHTYINMKQDTVIGRGTKAAHHYIHHKHTSGWWYSLPLVWHAFGIVMAVFAYRYLIDSPSFSDLHVMPVFVMGSITLKTVTHLYLPYLIGLLSVTWLNYAGGLFYWYSSWSPRSQGKTPAEELHLASSWAN